MMVAWNIFVGIFFIAVGFLVKDYPYLISGYNMMSEEQKKNVDIKGLSLFVRNGLVATGSAIIAGYALFSFLKIQNIADWIMLPVASTGILVLIIGSPKYDHNK